MTPPSNLPRPNLGTVIAQIGLACLPLTANADSEFFSDEGLPSVPQFSSSLIPVGQLNVSRRLVRSGLRPHVRWEIRFPMEFGDLMSIDPNSGLTAKEAVNVSVRVLGAGYTTVKSNNGHGNNADGVDVSNPGRGRGGPNGEVDRSGVIDDENKVNGNAKLSQAYLEAILSIRAGDGAAWQQIFNGSTADVDTNKVYYQGALAVGQSLDFAAGGGTKKGGWYEPVSTTTKSSQLIVLKDGDPLPATVRSFSTGEIQSYLSSYVDSNNNIVLGPREVIYLFDLDSQPGAKDYDLQDLGVHVLFDPVGDGQ